MDIELNHILRLTAAALAGGLIGFERELHDKPAGFRTNILICLGAAVFTLLSQQIAHAAGAGDPGRIAAQVVTGVGFLGAGAIIHSRGHVVGLTTAATIWVVAGVGMAFGAGFYGIGAVATLLVAGALYSLANFEKWMTRRRATARFEIEMAPSREVARRVDRLVNKSGLWCHEWRVRHGTDRDVGTLEVTGPVEKIDRLAEELSRDDGVRITRRR